MSCLGTAFILLVLFLYQFPSTFEALCPEHIQSNFTFNLNEDGQDNISCCNGTSTCKTLQYVLEDCEVDWFDEDVCIYVSNDQFITKKVNITLQDTRLYIIGNSTSKPSISQTSASGGIQFLTDDGIVTTYFSNLNFSNVQMEFEDLQDITIAESSFGMHPEFNEANAFLSIMNTSNLTLTQVEFIDYEVKIDSVQNLLIDASPFFQTKIKSTRDEESSINATWIFRNSVFKESEYTIPTALLTLEGAVNSISFINNTFEDNQCSLIILTTLNLVGSFAFHENRVINNTNLSISNFAIDLRTESKHDYCVGITTVSFVGNTFENNFGTKCLIGSETCCKTDSIYTNNTFHKNDLATMTVRASKGSTHNISFSEFTSNIANNVLMLFKTDLKCKTETETAESFTIIAKDLNFTGNSFFVTVNEDIQDPSVMTIQSEYADPVQCLLENLEFSNNYGTALTIINANITSLLGYLNFTENSGAFGGGMLLDNISLSKDAVMSNAELYFQENTAKYGGALYIIDKPCFLSSHVCYISLIFENNRATVEGNELYSQEPHCCCEFPILNFCNNLLVNNSKNGRPAIISGANEMHISASQTNNKSLSAFSGKNVALNFSIVDCAGTPVTCTAKVMALCAGEHQPYSCAGHSQGFKFEIEGPVYVSLQSGFININSNLSIQPVTDNNFNNLKPSLYFQCRDNRGYEKIGITSSVNVEVQECPLGFYFDSIHTTNCECGGNLQTLGKEYACDFSFGTICVRNRNWAGYINDITTNTSIIFVVECTSINCNSNISNRENCSNLDLPVSDYVRVDISHSNEDNRCVRSHSGLLCAACLKGTTNSFDGYMCINKSKCEEWHQPLLLILSTIWPILYGCFILFFIPRTENGVGSFYCTFFFLAVLRQYIKNFDGQYDGLTMVASFYVSTLLLGSRALGLLELCFYNIGGMWVSFYDFIGPFIIFLLLLTIVFIAKQCPTRFLRFQSYPVISMSIALVVTFWSVAFTSITLITPLNLPKFLDEYDIYIIRLEIAPTQLYLHDWHIPVFIISLVFLVLIACVALLLLVSPIFLGYFNKIKPFLDEFHHCYRQQYRWFSGVYFTSWIVLSICTILGAQVVFNSIIYALLVLHCMCQPYRKAWMNRVDMFYLIDLVIIISLDVAKSEPKWLYVGLKYITVIIPLLYITMCGAYMVGKVLKTPLQICLMHVNANRIIAAMRRVLPTSPIPYEIPNNQVVYNTVDRTGIAVTSFTVSLAGNDTDDFQQSKTKTENLEREPLLFSQVVANSV